MSSKGGIGAKTLYIIVGLVAVLVIAVGVAYYLSLPPAGQEVQVIKIGGVGPLSAPGASIQGVELKKGIEIAVELINQEGGLLGKKVELVFEDTQGTPEKGTTAMEKLIMQDKVPIVVGEYHSSVFLAEMEVARKYGIPIIDASAWSSTIRTKQYREVFATAPCTALNAEHEAKFIVASGFKNVLILAEDTDYGIDMARDLTSALRRLGFNGSVVTEIVSRTAKDFTPTLLKYKNLPTPPDIIVLPATPPAGFLIIKQAYEIGLVPEIALAYEVTGAGDRYTELWPAVGDGGKYLVYFTPYSPRITLTSLGDKVREIYKSRYGAEPTYIVFNGFDAAWAALHAIKKAGSTTPSALIKALETLDIMGTRGVIKFSNATSPAYYYHQWLEVPVLTCQYKEVNQAPTESDIIYPPEFATGTLVKP